LSSAPSVSPLPNAALWRSTGAPCSAKHAWARALACCPPHPSYLLPARISDGVRRRHGIDRAHLRQLDVLAVAGRWPISPGGRSARPSPFILEIVGIVVGGQPRLPQ